MKKFGFALSLFVVITFYSNLVIAQKTDDRVLLNIAGENVTAGDFMYVYNKNNLNREEQGPEAIKEYLDLYINFRLKVREAEELGMDTLETFRKELEGYRKQLAQPYFIDATVSENLLKEAYERKKWDIRASHILFRLDKNAPPEDTLAAYKKAIATRERIMNGEDFGKVAAEVSEDPSARDTEASQYRPARKGNMGDLGYFTVFDMIYAFETGAYNTEVGKISLPVRTDYGYHLIKVTDRQPAFGQAQVEHIFVALPPNANGKDSIQKKMKIDGAYEKILAGAKFEDVVAEYSEDKGSAGNGGKLPWFGCNRMVPEFIIATRNLPDTGSISAPFTTPFGYHIIKLIGRKPIGTFEEEEQSLKTRLEKDVRNKLSQESVIKRIQQENGFKEYQKAREAVLATLDTNLLKGEWDVNKAKGLEKVVFSIGSLKYTQQDLAKYIAQKQAKKTADIRTFFNDTYNAMVVEKCIAYEDSHLEEKYPDFRMLVQEYHDGILLFDLTDKNVWSKAVKDTTGLAEFFAANPGKYMWDKRFHATVVTILKPAQVNTDEIRDMFSNGKTPEEILNHYNTDTALNILVETSNFSKGDSPIVDKIKWKAGLSPMVDSPSGPSFVYGYDVIPPEPKLLQEARGLVTADYQTYLEDQWVKELRAKYNVITYQDVLATLK
jgi:peptidyl-prolyl cis-trans isomerase SurA